MVFSKKPEKDLEPFASEREREIEREKERDHF